MIQNLASVGLSEYEAKAYTALLGKNPISAYELAIESGIPTSKIYEVLSRLAEKKIVSILAEEGTKRYVPMDAREYIQGYRTKMEGTLKDLEDDLTAIGKVSDVSYIWNINDYGYFMDKAERLILGSEKTLLISAWKDEMENLADVLKVAEIKQVRIAVIHFGRPGLKFGQVFQHPVEDSIYAEKGGRGLVIVSDSKEVLMGTISDSGVEGAWSMNRGFVTLAEDYIRHDVYIMKIVKRFDASLRGTFGNRYEHLRNIFSD